MPSMSPSEQVLPILRFMSDSLPTTFTSKPKRVRTRRTAAADEVLSSQLHKPAGPLVQLPKPEQQYPAIPTQHYDGDHNADTILHSYGSNLSDAMENLGHCMFQYMITHPNRIQIVEELTHSFVIEANDLEELLFRYLTELLVRATNVIDELPSHQKQEVSKLSHLSGMAPRKITVVQFIDNQQPNESPNKVQLDDGSMETFIPSDSTIAPVYDLNASSFTRRYRLEVQIQGDFFDVTVVGAGCEIKAITSESTHVVRHTEDEADEKLRGNLHIQVLVDI